MPVKGLGSVKANAKKVLGELGGRYTKAAISKALVVGASNSKEIAPIEFGTLINSQYRGIEKTDRGWRGFVGYATNYALALESPKAGGRMDGWKPKPPEEKKGNAWNPISSQGFLRLGFEGIEAAPQIRKILIEGQRVR